MIHRYLLAFVAVAAFVALSPTKLQAAQINVLQNQGANWIGLDDSNPLAFDDDDPLTTLALLTPELNGTPGLFTVGEANFGSGIAGQGFLATKGGPIADIQMFVSGSASQYTMHLYDNGTTPAPGPNGGAHSTAIDLMPADTWFSFNAALPSVMVIPLASQGVDINLTKGNNYIFEIVARPPTPGSGALTWNRNGANNPYPFGHAYRDRAALNNSERDFALAVRIVPEPTTFGLLGLGMMGIVVASRRRAM